MERIWIAIAALSGACATTADIASRHIAAFAERSDYAVTGAHLGFVHALALLGVAILGLVSNTRTRPWLAASGWCFAAGQVLFSGSLYLFFAGLASWTGKLTMPGVILLVGGWLCLFLHAIRLGPVR
jgi:uncharacterized membrane protein YgdD (TMEM256/DUF423 family)